jgi:subtilisin-like proprotein convertase family protein
MKIEPPFLHHASRIHASRLVLVALLLLVIAPHPSALSAGIVTNSWSGSQVIPDNNASGVAFTFALPAGSWLVITNVTVDLTIAGGWNGDLYAYLSHGSGFAVLLNRIGSTSVNPGGSGVSGMNVELSDSYVKDIHTALNNPLTGNFAPDGRNVNPFTALNTDPRTAMLSSFDGLNPNGTWTLFFADVSPLATSTIQNWSVNIGMTVPEPNGFALMGLTGAAVLARRFARK